MFNFISKEPITNLFIVNILFSFLNFFLILKYTPSKDFGVKLFITSSVFLFSSMLFGGVLNPYHYFEFFFNLNIEERISYINSYSINRLPNILINNIFIFINFFTLKKYLDEGFIKKNNIYFLLFFVTCFLDTIIYVINLSVLMGILFYNWLKKEISVNQKLKLFLIFLCLIALMSFHFYNFYLLGENSYRHGLSKNDRPWTGNIVFAMEMIYFPFFLILFFYKNTSFVKISLFFLSICIIIFETARLIPELEFLSSRITHRNFEFLFSFLSFSLIYLLLIKSIKNKLFWLKILLFYLLHFIYLLFGNLITTTYLLVNLFIILLFGALLYFFKKNFSPLLKKKIFNLIRLTPIIIFIYTILIYFSGSNLDTKNIKFYKNEFELNQKQVFNWINDNLKQEDILLSFNKGLILNAEVHTGKSCQKNMNYYH